MDGSVGALYLYGDNKYRKELNIDRVAFGFGVFLKQVFLKLQMIHGDLLWGFRNKRNKQKKSQSTSEPQIVRTGNEELFGESAAVKGGDFLLQDHNKDPENTEMERPL